MSCILKEDHLRILRKVKKRALKIHVCGIVLTLLISAIPLYYQLGHTLRLEVYRVIRTEFNLLMDRYKLLDILRTKPLTVGQALDIADVVMEQDEVPVPLVLAIMEQESVFRPEAVSHKGARGLMQVMPVVWKIYADRPLLKDVERQMYDPAMNVRVGLLYLRDLKKKFGSWERVLRAYVGGPDRANDPAMDEYVDSVLLKTAFYEKEVK
jgi:hypothetical protein